MSLSACLPVCVRNATPADPPISVPACMPVSETQIDEEVKAQVATQMSDIHLSIETANADFLEQELRHNYTTPKSFLELIDFYKKLLQQKRQRVDESIDRLEKGLYALQDTKSKVEGLQQDLQEKMVKVKEKQSAAHVLIDQVTKASAAAEEEEKLASEEAAKTDVLAQEAATIQKEAEGELAEALPAMERAKAAVNCLTKGSIQVRVYAHTYLKDWMSRNE
eukprot:GHVU01078544.1.p1 GENE.GHVU01078544.1~~GHVU01078544.1.p1  ORF type:complete len:222 (+),score=64.06 GHVU01078544.1:1660-2325(+)